MRFSLSLWLLTSVACNTSSAFTISASPRALTSRVTTTSTTRRFVSSSDAPSDAAAAAAPTTPPPVLNGKMVLPLKVIKGGVDGHKVAAVYALVSSTFKRGSDGWKDVLSIGVTKDLASILEVDEDDDVSHVRALSFSFPQIDAMNDVADLWKKSVAEAGGNLVVETPAESADDMLRQAQMNARNAWADEDDDDDDDDDDIDMMMPPPPSVKYMTDAEGVVTRVGGAVDEDDGDVISPFVADAAAAAGERPKVLEFNAESVNLVLDEVRPYLIADGGNVSVDRVEEDTRNVYLKLEGACGSCASSTVTMQMGIEKVLKENFDDLGQVIQVDGEEEVPMELSTDMVMVEVNRIGPAIFAMGGQYELVGVNGETGSVELKFKGPNKLQQGLELALLDIPQCNYVKFSMYDE